MPMHAKRYVAGTSSVYRVTIHAGFFIRKIMILHENVIRCDASARP